MTPTTGRNHAADIDLMRQVAAGEDGALEQLISSHRSAVRRLAFRLLGWRADIDDLVQDVFITAFEKAAQYRGQASLSTWLTVITLNKSRTAMRSRALRERLTTLIGLRRPLANSAADVPEADELTAQVRSAVAGLPLRDREVIVLNHLEGKSPSDIAVLLGLPANTVQVRLYRARKRLKDRLQTYMQD